MVRISEFAGLIAGLVIFLGALFAVQTLMPHETSHRAELTETLD